MYPSAIPDKRGIPEAFVYRAENDEKQNEFREQFAKFFQETSFTALTRIYNATSLVKRVTWLVVVLGMMAWLTYQCYWLFDRFFRYPMEVKLDLKAAQVLDFPSVTICNLNPLQEELLHRRPFDKLGPFLQLQSKDMLFEEFQDSFYGDWEAERNRMHSSTPWNGGMNPSPSTTPMPGVFLPSSTPMSTDESSTPTSLDDSTAPTTFPTMVSSTTPASGTPPPVGTPSQAPSPPNRRRRRSAQILEFLKSKSFNKWDMLENENVSSQFYDKQDTEYTASLAYAYFTQITNKSEMEKGGQSPNDFIIDCKMEGFPCSPRNFTTFISHKYGNCFTFNAEGNGAKVKTRFAGHVYGLTLELYLDQKNYIPALAPSAGARVLIHPRNTMPFPEDEGISVAPGYSTSIGLRMVNITRIEPPYGECAKGGETEDYYKTYLKTQYTKLSCLKSCYQSLVMKYCNCSVPQYYVHENATVCNVSDPQIEKCSRNLPDQHKADFAQCDTLCPQPCQEIRYEETISFAQWPSKKYASYLQSKVQQSNYMFYNEDVSEGDFAKVEIYYEDLLYQRIEQSRAYGSENLISDIGGQLGLWLGLSAITLGELFSFIFSLGSACTHNVVQKKKSHAGAVEPADKPSLGYM